MLKQLKTILLSYEHLFFTLLEDNYNIHPKNLKSKSRASEGPVPTFIAPQLPRRIKRYRLNSQEYLLHQIIMFKTSDYEIKLVRSVVFIEYSSFLHHYITEIFLNVALNIIALTPHHSHGGMQADRKIEE